MDWIIQPASDAHLDAIRALLEASALSSDRVTSAQFYVARLTDKIIGCVGVELSGSTAMLRSLAVDPTQRNRGLGRALVDAAREHARRQRCTGVVALTLDASSFFARLGFRVIPRESLDTATIAHWQFSSGVCDGAVCLELPLRYTADATRVL